MSESRKCAACDRPAHQTETVCRECVRTTRRDLNQQHALMVELTVAMTRQTRMTAPTDGGRSAETPVPFAPAAASVLHQQRGVLAAWCRLAVDSNITPRPRAATVEAMAATLAAALPVLQTHEAAGDLVREIRHLTQAAWRVIDLPPNRLQFVAGPCPESYGQGADTAPCEGMVEVTVPRDQDEPPMARCPKCKVEWRSEHWLRMGHRIAQRVERENQQRELARSFQRSA